MAVTGLGLLTALIGAAALLGTQIAGSMARRSRDELLRVFSLGRRLLPYVLVGHIAMIATAVAAAVIYEVLAMWYVGKMSSGDFKGMLFTGFLAVGCLWTVWQIVQQLKLMRGMFKPSPMDVLGRVVTEAQAPGLWSHVRALAEKLGALPPQHIVVGMVEGFYVTAADVAVEPAGVTLQGRTLHVPLIHLALMDRAEASAVIGHELGHFAGADTDYTMRFLPIYDSVGRSLDGVYTAISEADWLQQYLMKPAFLFGLFFMESFDHAVNHWSREREMAADAAGVQVAGHEAAGSALVRISSSASHVDDSLSKVLHKPAAAPDDILLHVVNDMAAKPLTMPPELLAESLPHPSDSHPTTLARISALNLPVDGIVRQGTRPVDPVTTLNTLDGYFADAPTLRNQLGADLKARVVATEAETVEFLQTHAQAVQGECRLHQGARVMGIVITITGIAFLAVALFLATSHLWVAGSPTDKQIQLFILGGTGLGAIALLFIVRGWKFIANANKPMLIMTPDTLWFSNSKAPVPIAHLSDFSLIHGQGFFIRFELEPNAPLPTFNKREFGMPGARLFKKKRMIQLVTNKVCVDGKSLEAPALLETLAAYFNAGQARKALQEFK
jgi:Zn-dependent protease with chaperone function